MYSLCFWIALFKLALKTLFPEYSDVLKFGELIATFFPSSLTTPASADFIHNADYSAFLKNCPWESQDNT